METNEKSDLGAELQDSLNGMYNGCLKILWGGIDLIEKDLLNDPSLVHRSEKDEIRERLNEFSSSQEGMFNDLFEKFEEYTRRFVKTLEQTHVNRINLLEQSPSTASQSRNYSNQMEYERQLQSNPELVNLQRRIREQYNEHVRLKKMKHDLDKEIDNYESHCRHLDRVGEQFGEDKGEEKEVLQFVSDLYEVGAPLSRSMAEGRKFETQFFGNERDEEEGEEFNFRRDPNRDDVHFPHQNIPQFEGVLGTQNNQDDFEGGDTRKEAMIVTGD